MQYNSNYIKIPLWLLRLTSHKKSPIYLTPFELQLYSLIRGLNQKGKCYANDQYFSNTFGVTIKHINKSIHKLEHLEYVKITNERNKRYIELNNTITENCVFICLGSGNGNILVTQKGIYNPTENDMDTLSYLEGK